ncbi:MAG: LLM class F420-dependent oxidoreductase [Myxococcota bacterium]
MGRYGLHFPLESLPIHAQREWVQELEDLGYHDLWSGEAQDVDGFTPLAVASQWTSSMRLGCALFPVQTRGPALMAQSVAALCDVAPGRFVMGIGSSSEFIVRDWNGLPFEKPYAWTRDMATFLDDVFQGERVTKDYECFRVKGFKLKRKIAKPPLLIGALRPRMLELAGRLGDGPILNWILPEDLPRILPHARKHKEDVEIVVRIFAAPTGDREKVRAIAKMWIAGYLSVPTYRAQQEWLGRGAVFEKMWKLWEEGDRGGAIAAVPDDVADAFYPWGSGEQVREHVERYFAAGVDTVIVGLLEGAVDPIAASRAMAPGAR